MQTAKEKMLRKAILMLKTELDELEVRFKTMAAGGAHRKVLDEIEDAIESKLSELEALYDEYEEMPST
jgi:vacuolar-type H+-ATPase subunit E/Vma4